MIWNYALEDIINGYADEGEQFVCVACGRCFEKGRIYELDGELFDAWGAVRQHVLREHGSMAEFLVDREPGVIGVTEVQRQILKLILEGKSDKEISAAAGIALSTVRNHRFNLREKEKQAKMFLALMGARERETKRGSGKSDTGSIEEVPASAAMVDARFNITDQETEKTLAAYLDENGAIRQFPARAKKKIIVMKEVIKNFKKDAVYTETEVNRILKRIYEEDYPSLRRALIEYGFMERTADGSVYRVRE